MDLETTGLNRERDRIIQYGIFGTTGSILGCISHTALVNAETPTGRDPRNIPGIDPKDVMHAQPLRNKHLDILFTALHHKIVIMHNAAHDWTFIQNEFRRHGRMPPVPHMQICTYNWARRARLDGFLTLGDLCHRFGVPLPVAHHAWHDARATFYLFILWLHDTKLWAARPTGHIPLQYCSAYFLPSSTMWPAAPNWPTVIINSSLNNDLAKFAFQK